MIRKYHDLTQGIIKLSILNQLVFLLMAVGIVGCWNNLLVNDNDEPEVFGPDPATDNITCNHSRIFPVPGGVKKLSPMGIFYILLMALLMLVFSLCLYRYWEISKRKNILFASPIFGNYTGIPPLLIQVGEYEIIRDDSIQVAANAKAVGVDVTLEVWEGMIHVFQSHEPLLPEGREAIQHIADFMLKIP